MKIVKISELSGVALDWAVAKCEGFVQADDPPWEAGYEPFAYSTDWALAGPIIEREDIDVFGYGGSYRANLALHAKHPSRNVRSRFPHDGPTHLIAAMRAYAASKLGSVVEIPTELMSTDKYA